MKKVISVLLAVLMTAALFSGCGKKAAQDTAANGGTKSSGKVNEFGWEIPEKTIEITYFGGKRDGNNDFDKYGKRMQEYILKNFNVKLTRQLYDNEVSERVNLMLASNDYPGVLCAIWYDDVNKMADMGKLKDMNDLVQKYAPNLVKNMGNTLNRYKTEDGKLYKLADGYGYSGVPSYAANTRYDWYQEVGAPKFTTPDEWADVLKQMVAKHPKNDAGQKTYALGTSKDERLWLNLGGVWGQTWGWKVDDQYNAKLWANTDEALEGVKWANKMYREGLFDPDSFVQSNEEWGAKITNQRYAGLLSRTYEAAQYGHDKWVSTLGSKCTDETRYVPYDIHPANIQHSMLNPMGTTGWSFTSITDKCTNPEDVMKWINFENSELGMKLMGWGIPNDQYSVWNLKDGKWSWNEPVKKQIIDQTMPPDKGQDLGGGYYEFAMSIATMPDGTNRDYNDTFARESKWNQIRDKNLKDTIYDYSVNWAIQFPADDPVTVKKTQALDIYKAGYEQAIMAKSESECVAKMQEVKDKLAKIGVKDYEESYSKQFKKFKQEWKEK